MNFNELIKKRESVRKYENRSIEKEKITACIEAARLAPSACNSQPWKIVVVDDPELKEKVAGETYSQVVSFNKFVHTAPVILVLVMEKANLSAQIGAVVKKLRYSLIDIGIAAEHICLQAADLGLGTCILGWFNEKPIKKLLNIPSGRKIGLLITLGYPASDIVRNKIRKDLSNMSAYNTY